MVEIVNIVASGDFGREFDLHRMYLDISEFMVEAQFDPEVFPGLQLKVDEKGPMAILYSTGKYTTMGGKDPKQVDDFVEEIVSIFAQLNIDLEENEYRPEINNMICMEDLEIQLDLHLLTLTLGAGEVEYEPEQSPFVYYKPENLGCLLTIPSNGKVMVTGISEKQQANAAFKHLRDNLNGLKAAE